MDYNFLVVDWSSQRHIGSKEGDDDTYDGKALGTAAGSRSWQAGATVNPLMEDMFYVMITRTGADLMFHGRLGSTICFTNFGSHDPIVLYCISWYTESCYKGSLLYMYPLNDFITVFNLIMQMA